MITGSTPFVAETSNEIISGILSRQPAPPLSRFAHDVPERLHEIVEKALAKNNDERYQTSRDLVIDLKRLKQSLELKAGIDRSVSRESKAGESQARETAIASTALPTSHPTSSAEYIVNQVKSHKRVAVATTALLLIVATGIVIAGVSSYRSRQRAATAGTSSVKSLAVLPLKNVGGDPQDEYLSDGIADELITKLTKLKTVRVVSPSVAMRYKNSPKDAAEIGRELNVETVIEGTVRKVGTRFRLSIHLVNAQDGFEIWSDDDFESELNNLLDAEQQIAEAVASRLKGQLTPQERNLVARGGTTNADAYELFLRGKQQARKSEWQLARDLFDRAIQLDPNFADAYASRGLVIYLQFSLGNGDRSMLDAALSDANRALQIDPNIISARRTLINIYHSTGQYEEGIVNLTRQNNRLSVFDKMNPRSLQIVD
jgi:TolB-like protein